MEVFKYIKELYISVRPLGKDIIEIQMGKKVYEKLITESIKTRAKLILPIENKTIFGIEFDKNEKMKEGAIRFIISDLNFLTDNTVIQNIEFIEKEIPWKILEEEKRVVHKKPPLGVTPKWINDEYRIKELAEAMVRYVEVGLKVDLGWVKEYNALIAEYKGCE